MTSLRTQLLRSAQTFCDAFSSKKDLQTIISHFSTTHQPTAIEHGESYLAPFLGVPFSGLAGVRKYFETVNSLLTYEEMRFSEFIVDSEVCKVACKGKAKFTWIETGESWDETFAYHLDFDDERKITDYQVWADSGAAYLARIGKLNKLREERAFASRDKQ